MEFEKLYRLLNEDFETKSAIKRYVINTWIPKAEKILNLELSWRIDKKYIAITIKKRKDRNILAFIDRRTGDLLRPKSSRTPHIRYVPRSIRSNINDSSGGLKYVRNLRFRYLPKE